MPRPARAGCSMPTPQHRPASPTRARDSDMAVRNSVAVIGAGAYGTALACAAVRAGRAVTLHARSAESVAQLSATRKNPKLPGVSLDGGIGITADMAAAARAGILLLSTPAPKLPQAP